MLLNPRATADSFRPVANGFPSTPRSRFVRSAINSRGSHSSFSRNPKTIAPCGSRQLVSKRECRCRCAGVKCLPSDRIRSAVCATSALIFINGALTLSMTNLALISYKHGWQKTSKTTAGVVRLVADSMNSPNSEEERRLIRCY